jgi:hypothetical protein
VDKGHLLAAIDSSNTPSQSKSINFGTFFRSTFTVSDFL